LHNSYFASVNLWMGAKRGSQQSLAALHLLIVCTPADRVLHLLNVSAVLHLLIVCTDGMPSVLPSQQELPAPVECWEVTPAPPCGLDVLSM
jgi:hypothetical protein